MENPDKMRLRFIEKKPAAVKEGGEFVMKVIMFCRSFRDFSSLSLM